jgi:hypothetical protein
MVFSACKKDETEPDPVNLTELPGVAFLGHGYNTFGDWANPEEVRNAMISFDNFRKVTVSGVDYKVPEDVEYTGLEENEFVRYFGQNANAYRQQFASAAGLDNGHSYFNGAVGRHFVQSEYRLANMAFVGVENQIRLWKLSLPYDAASLKTMLSAQARTDLAAMAPAELFGQYGAFLLTEVVIGARAGYYAAVDVSAIDPGIDLTAAAELSFKDGLGEIDLSADPANEQMVNAFRQSAVFHLGFVGGEATYGQKLYTTGYFRKWVMSADDKPTLSGFTTLSLMPVWELCETASRRTELMEAFATYAQPHQLPALVGPERLCIAALSARSNATPAHPQLEGFRPMPFDLNEGAGGRHVYLYYQTGLDTEEAVTELTAVTGQDISPPYGWTKVGINLNDGAGGQFIYLSFQKGLSTTPVRELRVLSGDNPLVPDGFSLVGNYYRNNDPQDLNEAAGGQRLWLAYSRGPQP